MPINGSHRPSQEELDGIRVKAEAGLGDEGRIVIRPSGTEPIIRVMVQHTAAAKAKSLVKQLSAEISAL